MPPLKFFLSELFCENDVTIGVGEPNAGKSLFVVQMAQKIANGQSLYPFENQNTPKITLYFDFELNTRQFYARYSGVDFSQNFFRGVFNQLFEPENFESEVISQIERQVKSINANVVIIDNLTWLQNETEKGAEAGKFIKSLQRLKNQLNISIVVIAHTPKRSGTEPFRLNDIAGSSRLGNFIDSAFAIGKSIKDDGLRYVKCLKTRNDKLLYGTDNVAVFRLSTTDMLGFEYINNDYERNHLFETTEQKKMEEFEVIKDMFIRGIKQEEMAKELGCSIGKVNGIVKKVKETLKGNEK